MGLGGRSIKHYENIGYHIPRYKNQNGGLSVKRGTKILVSVNDLSDNSGVKVTKICDFCNKEVFTRYTDIILSRKRTDGKDRCGKCSMVYAAKTREKNLPYKKSFEYNAINSGKKDLLKEFSKNNVKKPHEIAQTSNKVFEWKCPDCKSLYPMKMSRRMKKGQGCIYCLGMSVNKTNCLWTTHPEVAQFLKDPQKGYMVKHNSTIEVDTKCPECGDLDRQTIFNLVQRLRKCPACADGVSYPEKFISNILNQTGVQYKRQKKFNWSKGKIYDFYLPTFDLIIETHGEQHYIERKIARGRTLKEEQENDRLKKALAERNGVTHYIIIDCRESQPNHIKKSVLNSKLKKLINLNKVDWGKCHKRSCNSLIREVCEFWSNGECDTEETAIQFNLSTTTVFSYLRKGSELGWCADPSERLFRTRKVVQLSLDNEYIQEWPSLKEAAAYTNIKSTSSITQVCHGVTQTAGGFRWIYKEDYVTGKRPVINTQAPNARKVIQLSLDGVFIREWNSFIEAEKELSIASSSISAVCRGVSVTAGGFRWSYVEDYDPHTVESMPKNRNGKPVLQLAKNSELIKEWGSISEASKGTKIGISGISAVCRGKRKTAGGFMWRFSSD